MLSIEKQIKAAKEEKQEKLKDLFFVEYCNNCKDLDIRGTYGKTYTPCHHPWYCWNDGGTVQQLEYEFGLIRESERVNGKLSSEEFMKLKELKSRRWELIKEGRRNLPKIKH